MRGLPFAVSVELVDWLLVWAHLELRRGIEIELREARREVSARVAQQHVGTTPAEHPVLAELRRLFRASGCDPTRYRPSSEALIRRLIKGEAIPEIHPLVDVSNCLSAETCLPCCVMREGSFVPPLCFRSGRPGEGYLSLRGPFNAAGKPLLVDAEGPCDTPITGSERVKVTGCTERAWLVVYVPERVVQMTDVLEALTELLRRAPAAEILGVGAATVSAPESGKRKDSTAPK